MKYKVTSNIPVPDKAARPGPTHKYPLKTMHVGDSFPVEKRISMPATINGEKREWTIRANPLASGDEHEYGVPMPFRVWRTA